MTLPADTILTPLFNISCLITGKYLRPLTTCSTFHRPLILQTTSLNRRRLFLSIMIESVAIITWDFGLTFDGKHCLGKGCGLRSPPAAFASYGTVDLRTS